MTDFTNNTNNDNNDRINEEKVTVESTSLPGFFARVCEKLKANPIATSVTLGLGIGAGTVGVMNHRRYGTVNPNFAVAPSDVGEVVQAAAEMVSSAARMFR